MNRSISIPLLILTLALSACAGKTATEPATEPAIPEGTGIKGQVYLAECQGDQVAVDCFSQEPYQATLIIFNGAMEEITRFETESDGTFVFDIAPGVYYLHPYSANPYPIATDYQFSVVAGEYTEINVVYDSGVR
jgi:hypothetical protein